MGKRVKAVCIGVVSCSSAFDRLGKQCWIVLRGQMGNLGGFAALLPVYPYVGYVGRYGDRLGSAGMLYVLITLGIVKKWYKCDSPVKGKQKSTKNT